PSSTTRTRRTWRSVRAITGPMVAAAFRAGITATSPVDGMARSSESDGATLRGHELCETIDRGEDPPALRDVRDLEPILFLETDHQLQEVDRVEIETAAHERRVVAEAVGIDLLQAEAPHDEMLQLTVESVVMGRHAATF